MAVSDLQNFFEVATGHRRNAVIRACGHVLSSLFSLLSSACFLPSRLRTRRGQGHGDCICAMDSFDAITIHPQNAAIRAVDRPRFGGQHGVEKGRSLWLGPLAGSFGDLWRSLWVCLLSSLFSLLSPLFSLLSSLFCLSSWSCDASIP